MNKQIRMAVVLAGVVTAMSAPAQTVAHWFDRQVHGTAAHITPRHHKPNEPVYQGSRPMRIIERRTVTRTVYRHHHRRMIRHRHHWDIDD